MTAADGSRVDLPDIATATNWTSRAQYRAPNGRVWEFLSGTADYPRAYAEVVGVPRLTDTLELDGFRALIGQGAWVEPRDGVRIDATVAAIVGNRYALMTTLYNVSVPEALETLALFSYEESEDGIHLKPVGRGWTYVMSSVLREVPDVALVEVSPLVKDVLQEIPPWAGTKVAAGEVFKDKQPNGADYYILVNQTTRCIVLPLVSSSAQGVAQLLETFTTRWAF